jgi:hypothetical protein
MLKRTGVDLPVNLDPEDNVGKNNRDFLTREFARLVQIKNVELEPCHVLNLGEVTLGGNSPEKRFSSNFLTVSLKSATTANKAYNYPSRPKPLVVLGPKATGLTWGIDRHPNWKENLPCFLQERKTSTPFHDLACFVLRRHGFISEATSLQEGIMDGLSEIFTQELCDYWKEKLASEKVFLRPVKDPFQDSVPNVFADHSWASRGKGADEKVALSSRINYLEGLLKVHNIEFNEK